MKFQSLVIAAFAATVLSTAAHGDGHTVQHVSAHTSKNIVEITAANHNFDTLLSAIIAADLAETLQGDGPYTVFAPTDEAFDALPEGTLENLLKPENKDQLVAILTYHVVPGTVTAEDVAGLSEAATVQGSKITVATSDSAVMVDGAHVVESDIEASNGVIHVIDKVILPQS